MIKKSLLAVLISLLLVSGVWATTTLTTNFGLPKPPLGTIGTVDGYGTLLDSADAAIKSALDGKLATGGNAASSTKWGAYLSVTGPTQGRTATAPDSDFTIVYQHIASVLLGTASTATGSAAFYNSGNANAFTIQPGATGAALSWTLPIAAAAGNGYLVTASTAGVLTYTDPATLGSGLPSQTGNNGKFLTTNGSAASWGTPAGVGVPTTITAANEATDTTCFPSFFTAATGDLGPKTNSGLTFNSNTGMLTATGLTGPLTGNASTATTATTGTNATNTAITDDTTTAATMYPTWVTANTGNLPQKTTSSKFTFNPSTGMLSSTGFTGALTGNASGSSGSCTGNAATATTAANLSGTPALPNGTTATTQSVGTNDTKLATTAFVLANTATQTVTKTATATAKDVVYMTAAGTAARAKADAFSTAKAIGFATETKTAASCIIQIAGVITITGKTFTPGEYVYVSPTTAGDCTQTSPTTGQQAQVLGIALTATDVEIGLGQVVEVGLETVDVSTAQTMTNKRVTEREVNSTTQSTLAINSDITDIYTLTAQSGVLALSAPTGTPTPGQKLTLVIVCPTTVGDITPTLTSGGFKAGTAVPFPAATVVGTTYMALRWDATNARWMLLATNVI